MSNSLLILTNQVAVSTHDRVAASLMDVFRAVTPQFYRHLTDDEVRMEYASIELLTAGIDNKVLAKMCELAVVNYPRERSRNEKTYFDVNYLLKYFEKAFDFIWCYSKQLSIDAELQESNYDPLTRIATEIWLDHGQQVIVRWLDKDNPYRKVRDDETRNSKKFWEVRQMQDNRRQEKWLAEIGGEA